MLLLFEVIVEQETSCLLIEGVRITSDRINFFFCSSTLRTPLTADVTDKQTSGLLVALPVSHFLRHRTEDIYPVSLLSNLIIPNVVLKLFDLLLEGPEHLNYVRPSVRPSVCLSVCLLLDYNEKLITHDSVCLSVCLSVTPAVSGNR